MVFGAWTAGGDVMHLSLLNLFTSAFLEQSGWRCVCVCPSVTGFEASRFSFSWSISASFYNRQIFFSPGQKFWSASAERVLARERNELTHYPCTRFENKRNQGPLFFFQILFPYMYCITYFIPISLFSVWPYRKQKVNFLFLRFSGAAARSEGH